MNDPRSDRPELVANDPRWLDIMLQAQREGDWRNLPKPVGLPEQGRYSIKRHVWKDGSARITLYLHYIYRVNPGCRRPVKNVTIGSFVDAEQAPGHVRPIPVGRVISLTSAPGRQVRVAEDAPGLAWPVPIELWKETS